METTDPPTRFPPLSTDVFEAGESAGAESPPLSPRTQLPAYGDERAPPQYQADGLSKAQEAAEEATRRTLFIRLLSSVFVTVLVSLVVAAAVGRIHDRQAAEKKSKDEQRANETGLGVKLQAGNDAPKASPAAALVFTVM
ncbi:hypothetical protein Trco_006026 [Trichoderma cornu-damae]|uniref:Transmembrane protein n=1 Tax=Trichoderma cornu-damae TaxID=654480 RepID=A0A9P8QPM0_9HYPO|nr:hypothetical protein Trco_006026 [Trichoderma cornu-damae]